MRKFFGKSKIAKRRAAKNRQFETLERKQPLAADFTSDIVFEGGNAYLDIYGTDYNDKIFLEEVDVNGDQKVRVTVTVDDSDAPAGGGFTNVANGDSFVNVFDLDLIEASVEANGFDFQGVRVFGDGYDMGGTTGGGRTPDSKSDPWDDDGRDGDDMIDATGVKNNVNYAFTLFGQGGDDMLRGTKRTDTLVGGDGDDSILNADHNDSIFGGDGFDTLRYDQDSLGITLAPSSCVEDVVGTDHDDDINLCTATADVTIDGGDGNDTLRGGSGDDTITGGKGHDSIFGKAGDDDLRGGEGNDSIFGDEDDDDISGGAGNDYIDGDNMGMMGGGGGDDVIRGGDDDDVLLGQSGKDEIRGNAGDDSITGGIDDDDLFGNAGDDVFLSSHDKGPDQNDGADNINGGNGGERFGDTVMYMTDTEGMFIDLGAGKAKDGDGVQADWDDVTMDSPLASDGTPPPPGTPLDDKFGTGADDGFDDDGITDDLELIENAVGGSGHDTIVGDGRNNTLTGKEGMDSLVGRGGDDVIFGNEGRDFIEGDGETGFGNASPDDGQDMLFGGEGRDTIFASDKEESLFGSEDGDLIDGGKGRDFLFGDDGEDDIIGGNNDDNINGGDGDDTIDGGQGDDLIIGGLGSDVLFGGPNPLAPGGDLDTFVIEYDNDISTPAFGIQDQIIVGGSFDDDFWVYGTDGKLSTSDATFAEQQLDDDNVAPFSDYSAPVDAFFADTVTLVPPVPSLDPDDFNDFTNDDD